MFEDLVREIQNLGSPLAAKASLDALAKFIPEKYTWSDIATELDTPPLIPGVLICLYMPARLEPRDDDAASQTKISDQAAAAALPGIPGTDSSSPTNEIVATRTMALMTLGAMANSFSLSLSDQALLALAGFTNTKDPWTTHEMSSYTGLLESQLCDTERAERFIVVTVLTNFLRPLFSKSRPSTITSSGRKAEFVQDDRRAGLPDDSARTKPWKYEKPYSIPIFEYAVKLSSESLVSEHWPLYTPVLLTLVDDPDVQIRSRGLLVLSQFLEKFSSKALKETGLSSVFEEAVLPILSYLPTLTPEADSIELLEPAYASLVILGRKLYPDEKYSKPKGKFFDKVLRDGVFMGHQHAGEHVKIARVLMQATTAILDEMGIYAVKHLVRLLQMLSAVLTDPFGPAHPPLLLSGIEALQAVMRNCWPRLDQEDHQNKIIDSLTFCWLNVLDDETLRKDAKTDISLRDGLKKAAKMLEACMESAGYSLEERMVPLIEQEPRLKGLLSRDPSEPRSSS